MIGSIGQNVGAAQGYQPTSAAPAPTPAPAPEASPAPTPVAAPSTYEVPLNAPGDANECTSCGRAALTKAYDMQAMEQGSVDANVLAQVAASYAASRPAAA